MEDTSRRPPHLHVCTNTLHNTTVYILFLNTFSVHTCTHNQRMGGGGGGGGAAKIQGPLNEPCYLCEINNAMCHMHLIVSCHVYTWLNIHVPLIPGRSMEADSLIPMPLRTILSEPSRPWPEQVTICGRKNITSSITAGPLLATPQHQAHLHLSHCKSK